ncbi:hypothetical protein EVAR_52866_1 [Eumeta japonica]|uniref:Uncharacterized protein n=1 Tax=Eumeta variegata TaxID=151549 RepID=A0A4C1YIW6_EUMVA|nr:hypothetical protein EVAR_52866_1 [Eumeta japonica]
MVRLLVGEELRYREYIRNNLSSPPRPLRRARLAGEKRRARRHLQRRTRAAPLFDEVWKEMRFIGSAFKFRDGAFKPMRRELPLTSLRTSAVEIRQFLCEPYTDGSLRNTRPTGARRIQTSARARARARPRDGGWHEAPLEIAAGENTLINGQLKRRRHHAHAPLAVRSTAARKTCSLLSHSRACPWRETKSPSIQRITHLQWFITVFYQHLCTARAPSGAVNFLGRKSHRPRCGGRRGCVAQHTNAAGGAAAYHKITGHRDHPVTNPGKFSKISNIDDKKPLSVSPPFVKYFITHFACGCAGVDAELIPSSFVTNDHVFNEDPDLGHALNFNSDFDLVLTLESDFGLTLARDPSLKFNSDSDITLDSDSAFDSNPIKFFRGNAYS